MSGQGRAGSWSAGGAINGSIRAVSACVNCGKPQLPSPAGTANQPCHRTTSLVHKSACSLSALYSTPQIAMLSAWAASRRSLARAVASRAAAAVSWRGMSDQAKSQAPCMNEKGEITRSSQRVWSTDASQLHQR